MSRLGQQIFLARKRSTNEAAAAEIGHVVISQDVMILAFVPLSASSRVLSVTLISKESPHYLYT